MAKDRVFPEDPMTFSDAVIGLASPKDRLASYILDCTLLLPLVQLLQAPIRRWILESYLYDQGSSVASFQSVNLVIFVSLFITYYTLMIWWKGQTLGKMFFGVKVISYRGELRFIDCVARAVAIFFEFLLFCLPLTAIFSHPMRRPMHDRVADTLVISQKNPAGFPSSKERWQARFVNAGLVLVMGLFGTVYFSMRTEIQAPSLSASAEEACEHSTFHDADNLEKLVELNLVAKVSHDCLFVKARELVWQEGDTPLGIFALGLSLRYDLNRSNEYLANICPTNENHHLCNVSRWLQDNNKGMQRSLSELIDELKDKKPYPFVNALMAMHLTEQRRYLEAEKMLSKIKNPGELQPLVASLYFHSLVGQLRWDEAKWVFKTHDNLGDRDILYFMQRELAESRFSTKQQLQLLEHFYPSLAERSLGREPASAGQIPSEIKDIHRLLESRL